MKTIFIAGSRKFYSEITDLVNQLQQLHIKALKPLKPKEADDFETEKKALLTAFEIIDASELVYVYAKDGYIGKAVAMEIAYAYAKNKQIIASEEIQELSARALISKISSVRDIVKEMQQIIN